MTSQAIVWTPLEWLGFEVAVQEALVLHRKQGVARLIRVLVQHPGRTLRRDQLVNLCSRYGFQGVHEATLKIYVSFARDALADLGFEGAVQTIPGVGYAIDGESAAQFQAFIVRRLAA